MRRASGGVPTRVDAGGQAVAEYAALVAVVVGLVLVLTVLGSRRAGRVPIDPVRSVGALVVPPPVVRVPRTAPRRAVPGPRIVPPRRPRARPPRPGRPVVTGPRWAVRP
jgi:hypothetical protein